MDNLVLLSDRLRVLTGSNPAEADSWIYFARILSDWHWCCAELFTCRFHTRYIEVSRYLWTFDTDTSWYHETSIYRVSTVAYDTWRYIVASQVAYDSIPSKIVDIEALPKNLDISVATTERSMPNYYIGLAYWNRWLRNAVIQYYRSIVWLIRYRKQHSQQQKRLLLPFIIARCDADELSNGPWFSLILIIINLNFSERYYLFEIQA